MDTVIGNLCRLIWRKWYVLAIGVILGVLAGAWLTTPSYEQSQTLSFASLSNAAGTMDLKLSDLQGAGAAAAAVSDFDQDAANAGHTAQAVWNETAKSILVVVTGSNASSTSAALSRLTDDIAARALQPLTAAISGATTAANTQIDALLAGERDAESTVQSLSQNDPARTVLLTNLSTDRSKRLEIAGRRDNLVQLGKDVPTLVVKNAVQSSAGGSRLLGAIAGGIGGAALTLGLMAIVVVSDNRVRSRCHVSRKVAGTPVLAVLGSPADLPVTALESVRRFVENSNIERLFVLPLRRQVTAAASLGDALRTKLSIDVVTATDGITAINRSDRTGYVLAIESGKTTADQLSSRVIELRAAGAESIGTVLVGVPNSERAWASAGCDDVIQDG